MNPELLKIYIDKIKGVGASITKPFYTVNELKNTAVEVGVLEEEWTWVMQAYEDFIAKGESYMAAGNESDAIEELEQAYAIYPYNPQVLYLLAQAYFDRWTEKRRTNDKKQGIAYAEACLQVEPENRTAAQIISELKNAPFQPWISWKTQLTAVRYLVFLAILGGIYWFYQKNQEIIHKYINDSFKEIPKLTGKGDIFVLKNVIFTSGSTTLSTPAKQELDDLIAHLKKYQDLKGEIGGHTDNIGDSRYNQQISEQRARVVFDYLVSKGIAASRLTYRGYGDSRPAFPNDIEENRAKNRRIEFKVL
ncbi:MAG: OmpA family protein [Microscillaceae bacterium]|jgi:outer membrane protein OmpA-like peptidoglycan-associated protein|nr:OmpA family protein [Microscillaceae bacterium]